MQSEIGIIKDEARRAINTFSPLTKSPISEAIMAIHDSTESVPKSKTSTYKIWQGMKKRCLNPASNVYSYYGERGITVCDRWLESYDNFLADMGERPDGLNART